MTTHAQITGSLNKTELGQAVAAELGISPEDGIQAVETTLDIITRTVAGGHTVTVTNFGAFVPVQKAARGARNPQNGERVTIPPRQEIRFRRSDRLRQVIQGADPATATIRKHPKTPKAVG